MEDKATHVLKTIIQAIVDNPDDVEVARSIDEMGVLLKVKVADKDWGLVIGRQGDSARKIREVMRLIGMSSNEHIGVVLDAPELPNRPRR